MSSPGDGGSTSFSVKWDISYLKAQLSLVLGDYKGWIARNPGRASDVESFFKILAYLLPGRVRGNSTVLPELVYSTANAVSFWHDYILKQNEAMIAAQFRAERLIPNDHHRNGAIPGPSSGIPNGVIHEESNIGETQESVEDRVTSRKKHIFRIRVALTILEYFEVFLEVAARRLWGDPGRWIVIFCLQTVKAGLRAVLLFYYKVGLSRSPAIPVFDRTKYQPNKIPTGQQDVVFVLKHSGRVIRKLHAAPPLHSRDWTVPENPFQEDEERHLPPEKLLAEVVHIARPLCHLVTLGACGAASWKPWMVSLAMDLGSLYLHGDPLKIRNKSDRIELKRRSLSLLLYLMRSPFYDNTTKVRLISSLEAVGSRVPLVGNLLLLLAQAIPQWQQTYSYVWS